VLEKIITLEGKINELKNVVQELEDAKGFAVQLENEHRELEEKIMAILAKYEETQNFIKSKEEAVKELKNDIKNLAMSIDAVQEDKENNQEDYTDV